MGKKSKPPKAPDLTPISNAQLEIAKQSNELAREFMGLSREQFAWMKENATAEYNLAKEQADRLFEFQNRAFESDEAMKEFSRQVGQTQMDAMNLQKQYAQEDRKRYEDVFLPMQDRMISEANAYDTPERREAEAARAQVDIQRQAEAARTNADARLRSMGIDPSQMRSSSLLQTQDVAMAAQQAAAGNQARQNVEDRGRALRADAINMGMGLPSQAAAGFQGSNASGAGAINAGQAGQQANLAALQGGAGLMGTGLGFRSQALGNLANLTGSPTQWANMGMGGLGQASNAYGNAANTMSQGFNNQMASWQAGQQQAQQNFSNIMSVASMAGGMMMAEGGAVRRYAEGGGVKREKFPLAKQAIQVSDVGVSAPARVSKPAGPGMMDRLGGAMDFAAQHQAENLWEGAAPIRSAIVVPQTQFQSYPAVEYQAEGGPMRARGALPRRQSRDVIPAYLAEGEYVVPADVVNAKGLEFFDKLVQKHHRENA
jgi:hypothetical protein